MYLNGSGVEANRPRGLALLRNACRAGSEASCGLYDQTPEGQFETFDAACADGAGTPAACYLVANGYVKGDHVQKDVKKGIEIGKRACEHGNADSCALVTLAYMDGSAGAPDFTMAAAFATRACDRGHADSCAMLGVLYDSGNGVGKDPRRAFALYQQACKASHGRAGCGEMAEHYIKGDTVKKDAHVGRELLLRACPAGDDYACRVLKDLDAAKP
jgi:TPR repeat protein